MGQCSCIVHSRNFVWGAVQLVSSIPIGPGIGGVLWPLVQGLCMGSPGPYLSEIKPFLHGFCLYFHSNRRTSDLSVFWHLLCSFPIVGLSSHNWRGRIPTLSIPARWRTVEPRELWPCLGNTVGGLHNSVLHTGAVALQCCHLQPPPAAGPIVC